MPTNDRINTILGRNMVIYDANNRAKRRSDSSNGAPGGRIESELRQGESLRTEKQPGKQEIEAAERSDAALR